MPLISDRYNVWSPVIAFLLAQMMAGILGFIHIRDDVALLNERQAQTLRRLDVIEQRQNHQTDRLNEIWGRPSAGR